jgi:hypothetical protein
MSYITLKKLNGLLTRSNIKILGKNGVPKFADVKPADSNFKVIIDWKNTSSIYQEIYGPIVKAAENLWNNILIGLKEITGKHSCVISFSFEDLDTGILGHASPLPNEIYLNQFNTYLRLTTNYATAKTGTMAFSTKFYKTDFNSLPNSVTYDQWKAGIISKSQALSYYNEFFSVVCHEMGHVLGIGSLWNGTTRYLFINNKATDLTKYLSQNRVLEGTTSHPKYIGPAGLAAWRSEISGQENAEYIPVEEYELTETTMWGSNGTGGVHWNEEDGGSLLTGLFDKKGRDIRDEFMTGWSAIDLAWIGRFTLASLEDIGYIVDYNVLEYGLEEFKYSI